MKIHVIAIYYYYFLLGKGLVSLKNPIGSVLLSISGLLLLLLYHILLRGNNEIVSPSVVLEFDPLRLWAVVNVEMVWLDAPDAADAAGASLPLIIDANIDKEEG